MPDIYVQNNFYQSTSQACIVDLTPPTFAGIASAAVQSRGQIRATWLAATESMSLPVRYEVYVQASTATGLFNTANIIGITDKLQLDFWQTPDGVFLVNGTTYYVGVRALDAVGNRDTNLINQSVISTGVFTGADVYLAEGAFTVNTSNLFQGTIWALKNSTLALSGNSVLGIASYQVYDKAGAAVAGMSEAGIVADVNGQYKITPVASLLNESLDHYQVKVTVNVDGADRINYVPLIQPLPDYNIEGVFSLDSGNNLVGTFWSTANEQIITNPARLGTASYQVYDANGAAVVGMSESGITVDANGQFKITPMPSILVLGLEFYVAKVTITIDAVPRSDYLTINGERSTYAVKAVFSINASNQLQATLWASSDGTVVTGARLGAANYTIYNSAGAAVAGLTQSGISADGNGRFLITPVSAALLTDLTHYTAKIGIVVDGVERVAYKGFTLLGN